MWWFLKTHVLCKKDSWCAKLKADFIIVLGDQIGPESWCSGRLLLTFAINSAHCDFVRRTEMKRAEGTTHEAPFRSKSIKETCLNSEGGGNQGGEKWEEEELVDWRLRKEKTRALMLLKVRMCDWDWDSTGMVGWIERSNQIVIRIHDYIPYLHPCPLNLFIGFV